jgi:hypothetical protein
MFLTIASGATPIGSAGHAPDETFTCIKRVKKKNEDSDSHREGVYVNKVE